jgi:L-iditol 2-dehydrogenase
MTTPFETVHSVVIDMVGDQITAQPGQTQVRPPAPNEIRVRPAYVGICGSDLEILRGNMPQTSVSSKSGRKQPWKIAASGC